MTTQKFSQTCDICRKRGSEYSSFTNPCSSCGQDICKDCIDTPCSYTFNLKEIVHPEHDVDFEYDE